VSKKILAMKPDLVGFYALEDTLEEVSSIVHCLLEAGFRGRMIAGGPSASSAPENICSALKGKVEILPGYAEQALSAIAKETTDNFCPSSTNWPLTKRDDAKTALRKGFALGISSSRGCSQGSCPFCVLASASRKLGTRWHARPVASVVSELLKLQERYQPNWITFTDEDFLGPSPMAKERASRLATSLIEQKFSTPWMMDCRINQVDEALFALLKKAGLSRVFIGIEHHTDAALTRLGKKTNVSNVSEVVKLLGNLGITVVPGYIQFLPGETPYDSLDSFRFFRGLNHYDLGKGCSTLRFYAGTSVAINSAVKAPTPWFREAMTLIAAYHAHVLPQYLRWTGNQSVVPSEWLQRFAQCHYDTVEMIIQRYIGGEVTPASSCDISCLQQAYEKFNDLASTYESLRK
jgi:ribosome modulation factor